MKNFFRPDAEKNPSRRSVSCVVRETIGICDISLHLIWNAPRCALAGACARCVHVYNKVFV